MVHLLLDAVVADWYRLMVAGRLVEELAVVRLVGGEFRVVCGRGSGNLTERDEVAPRTFEHADDPEEDVVLQYVFIQAMIVQHNCGCVVEGMHVKRGVVTHVLIAYSYIMCGGCRGFRDLPPG